MGVIKRKGTRKIRKNRRTQRRKNRSYKRMKGGAFGFQNKKIVKLLTNLIINNFKEERITQLCRPQSQSLSTAEQPLLPTAEQPLLLKNANEVNQILMKMYRDTIKVMRDTGNFEYTFDKDPITISIIDALKSKDISYFDNLVEKKSTVPILSPDDFDSSLTSPFKRVFIKDQLVYSMFALSEGCITIMPYTLNNVTAKIDLNEPVCPPISDV